MIARLHGQNGCCGGDHHEMDGGGVQIATALSGRPTVDQPRIEAAVREILIAIGENPDRDGLLDTPARVARAYSEIFGGLSQDPAEHLSRVFEQESDGPVVLRGIPFTSMCEHHLLPFVGTVDVAYLPSGGKVVGLSKLARTVEVFARRPQVQERLTGQIAQAIEENLRPAGVAVVVRSAHMCMSIRGVGKSGSEMVTTAMRGVYQTDVAQRREIMALMKG